MLLDETLRTARSMRGLIAGLAGFTAFFVVIALALETLGIAVSYLLALAAVTLVQAITLRRLRRGPVPLAG